MALLVVITVALLGGPCAAPAGAQVFGQWNWDALFGAGQRAYENLVDGERVGSFDQRDIQFAFGVNGFILHPAVARFRVGFDGLFSGYTGARTLGTDRWGLRGDLRLFPIGKYRVNLYAARELYDYADFAASDLFALRGIPDTATSFGGRVRVSQGRLRGTLIGFDRRNIDLLETEDADDVDTRQFLDWARAGTRFQRHFRLERRVREFGAVGFGTDNLTANFDQQGELSETWRWNLFGTGIRQGLGFDSSPASPVDTFRLRNQLIHYRGEDLVDLAYSGGWLLGGDRGSFQSHALSARYRWMVDPDWEVAPFVTYGLVLSSGASVRSPQAGVSTVWSRAGNGLDLSVTGGASVAFIQTSAAGQSRGDTQFGLSASGTLGHGEESRLRTELEASAGRNQLRLGAEAVVNLPELLLPVGAAGSEDVLRGRATLRRRWRNILFSGYTEWSRRRRDRPLIGDAFAADSLTETVQVSARRFSFLFNLGTTRVEPTSQKVHFLGTSLTLRPWRLLSVHAAHRRDDRRLIIAPDIDGEWSEVGASLRLGAFDIQVRAYSNNERRLGVAERNNRGLTWTVLRRFQGWLPIITRGPSRGGLR